MPAEPRSSEKPARRRGGGPFGLILTIVRGLLFDSHRRRQTMVYLIAAALGMALVGGTLGFEALRANVPLFVMFWLTCAFLTVVATLLAIYDLLALRLHGRRVQRELHARMSGEAGLKPRDPRIDAD